MAAPKGIDWDAIRQEYVTTKKSCKKIADEHGIECTRVSRRCAAYGWVKQRNDYHKKVADRAIKKAAEKESNRLARLICAADTAGDVATMGLRRISRALEALEKCEPEERELFRADADSKAARDYTVVLKEIIGIMRDYYDIPTPAEREERELAREKLKIERERMEKGLSTDGGAFEHGVCLLPAVMEAPKPPISELEHGEKEE